jgi:5-methylthioadenosine/S-adenosylhomocysteine deaminase
MKGSIERNIIHRLIVTRVHVAALLGVLSVTTAWSADWAMTGTVIAPNSVISDGMIAISGAKISAVGSGAALPAGVSALKVQGVILPGFVDLHNHLTWNVLPRWLPAHRFSNRYEWQDDPEYDRLLVAPHDAVLDVAACETVMFAEIRVLAGGATSVVGNLSPTDEHRDYRKCAAGLARNLDVWSDLPNALPEPLIDPCQKDRAHPQALLDVVVNEVYPLEVPHDRLDFLRCELESGRLHGMIVHLSEGAPTDASAHHEFAMLDRAGLLMPGLAVVHGTAMHAEDFARMNGAGLVWSPRSNDELYGATADVRAAMAQKVNIAIAPDWSPTGSAGMLQEIGYAARRHGVFTPERLIAMATAIPAKMVRVDAYIGSLAPGLMADFIVLRDNGGTPAQSVVNATPADMMLVVVGGVPVFGDPALLRQLLPADTRLDRLTVCGADKSVNLAGTFAAGVHESLADIQAKLNATLTRLGLHLAEIECD